MELIGILINLRINQKKGGKGKIIIPSGLGYGSKSISEIPANSVLIFEIELVDIF